MEFGVWWPESFTEGCQRLEYLSYIALKIVLWRRDAFIDTHFNSADNWWIVML